MVGPESGTEYNWHPQVHTHMGEELWFFLIRFKDPTVGAVEDQLRAVLNEAGIVHACRYTLYGFWDGLVRAWMTEAMTRRFLRLVKDRRVELGIDDVRPFEVTELHYLWRGDPNLLESGPSIEKLNAFEEAIEAVRGDASLLQPKVREDLIGNKLLIKRPPVSSTGVKLYVTLGHTASSSFTQDQEVEHMLRAIQAAGFAEHCSLYVGHRFARFFLRCSAKDFDSAHELNEQLYLQLRDLHKIGLALRPMTFMIINASAESDNLNCFGSLSRVDESTAERLELTALGRRRFGTMSQPQRARYHELVLRIDSLSLSDERLSPKLTGFLRACIEEDIDGVNASCAFVFDFEWLFHQYMLRVWGSQYGSDWISELSTRIAALNPPGGVPGGLQSSPAEWTFGAVHKFAELSGLADPDIQDALVRDLGADWHGRVKALVEIRNFAAHSKARRVAQLSNLSGQWGRQVEEIINSAEFYFRLDNLKPRKDTQDDDEQLDPQAVAN